MVIQINRRRRAAEMKPSDYYLKKKHYQSIPLGHKAVIDLSPRSSLSIDSRGKIKHKRVHEKFFTRHETHLEKGEKARIGRNKQVFRTDEWMTPLFKKFNSLTLRRRSAGSESNLEREFLLGIEDDSVKSYDENSKGHVRIIHHPEGGVLVKPAEGVEMQIKKKKSIKF